MRHLSSPLFHLWAALGGTLSLYVGPSLLLGLFAGSSLPEPLQPHLSLWLFWDYVNLFTPIESSLSAWLCLYLHWFIICVDLNFIDRGQTIFLMLHFFLKEDASGNPRADIPLAYIPTVSCAPWKGLGIIPSSSFLLLGKQWWEMCTEWMDGWTDGGSHVKDRIRVLFNKYFKV